MSKDITIYNLDEANQLVAAVRMYRDYYEPHVESKEEELKLKLLVAKCESAAMEIERQVAVGTLSESDNFRREMRDMFAAAALTGLVANGAYVTADECAEKIAKDAYWYADAMLIERDKDA